MRPVASFQASDLDAHHVLVCDFGKAVGLILVKVYDKKDRYRTAMFQGQQADASRLDQPFDRDGWVCDNLGILNDQIRAVIGNQLGSHRNHLQRHRGLALTRAPPDHHATPINRDGGGVDRAFGHGRFRWAGRPQSARQGDQRRYRRPWAGYFLPRSRRHALRQSASRSPARGRSYCQNALPGAANKNA